MLIESKGIKFIPKTHNKEEDVFPKVSLYTIAKCKQ